MFLMVGRRLLRSVLIKLDVFFCKGTGNVLGVGTGLNLDSYDKTQITSSH
jgi:hypothetical protein